MAQPLAQHQQLHGGDHVRSLVEHDTFSAMAHGGIGDPQAREHLQLAFRRGAAVAAHGGQDERAAAPLLHGGNDRGQHLGQAGVIVQAGPEACVVIEYFNDSIWESHYFPCQPTGATVPVKLTEEERKMGCAASWIDLYDFLSLLESYESTNPYGANILERELVVQRVTDDRVLGRDAVVTVTAPAS